MHMFAQVLIVAGVSAGLIAFVTGLYVVMYGWKYPNPRDHHNPDWLVVLLRLYKPQIIAYFLLLAAFLAAILLDIHRNENISLGNVDSSAECCSLSKIS